MHNDKLRIADSNGLVPAGRYFKVLTEALREVNACDQRTAPAAPARERAPRSRALVMAH